MPRTVTFSRLGSEESPRASVTTSVTLNAPALVYVCRGLASVLRKPSPKSQRDASTSPSGSVDAASSTRCCNKKPRPIAAPASYSPRPRAMIRRWISEVPE